MKEIRCLKVRKIWSDNRHNAFTSICIFKENIYIAFRSAEHHATMDGAIRIIRSSDHGETWQSIAFITMDNRDLRDPRLIEFGDTLHLFAFARQQNKSCESFHFTSSDGENFSVPQKIPGISIAWGFAKQDDKLYCADYYIADNSKCYPRLFASNDAENWEKLFDFPFPGNETSLDFDENKNLHIFVRDAAPGNIPAVFKLPTPVNETSPIPQPDPKFPLRMVGTMLKRLYGASLLIGRCWDDGYTPAARRNKRCDVYIMPDGKAPEFCFTLPSGGDTSYASYCEQAPGRALVCYYSSHEHLMAYPIEDDSGKEPAMHTYADIFLAEFSHNFLQKK